MREATLDLRREARERPLALPDLGITDDERAQAVENWRARMISEHASARVFAELTSQMMRANLDRHWIVSASRMVGQELEHGLLCARVVHALGGEARAPMPAILPSVPKHDDASAKVAVLRNIVSISCCSETVAVSLVATERERAGAPELKKILSTILADEVKHSRLGWKLLAEVLPTLAKEERAALDAYLPFALEHQVDFHSPFLTMGPKTDRAVGAGAADGPNNWACFVETLTGVILPGLEGLGLGANEAWSETLAHLPAERRWVHAA
jgi:hypothetical protein